MKTVEKLSAAFAVYWDEIDRCKKAEAYWSLLHLVLVLPDVCASLEAGASPKVGDDRYIKWCAENFPANKRMKPVDRYQIRNAVLHSGSTLTESRSKRPDKQTQYTSISFVQPGAVDVDVHQDVTVTAGGKNLTLDVSKMATEVQSAVHRWFRKLVRNPSRLVRVERNLSRIARLQVKESRLLTEDGDAILTEDGNYIIGMRYPTTSST